MEKNIVKLKNGITFISQKLNNIHSVTISVNFKVGSLYENENNSGITHLIEHLFFRQWDSLPQRQLYYEMQCMGAEIVGKTFYDYVNFSITVTPDSFVEAFKLIIKCLNEFNWTDNIVSSEKRVVCKQIENDYQNYDKWVDSYYFKKRNYINHIMGTIKSVQSLSVKDINLWKEKYFCSNNSCVAITGNYSDEDFLTIQNIICQIKSSGKLAETIISYPLHFEKRSISNRYAIVSNDTEISDVTIFIDINSDYNYETVRLLSSMLGEGCGSLLSMVLRETYNFTDDIYTNLKCYCGFYRLSISFSVNNEDFLESMHHFFKSIVSFKNEISINDYLTSISFFTKNQLFDLDNSAELNNNYVLCDFVLYPTIISEPIKRKEIYENIKINDLKKCANDIFIAKNLSFLIQTNLDKKFIKNTLEKMINTL
ncbi:MAG: insulinase family protein [Ruminococcus sp.]|nr:insulinase family protein [Ruminococcus sp.]